MRAPYNPENSTGLWAMIWGLVGFFVPVLVFPQITALVLGVKGNRKVNSGVADNKGQAVTGIVLGALGCASIAILVLLFGSVLTTAVLARSTSPSAVSESRADIAPGSSSSPVGGTVEIDGEQVPGIVQGSSGPILVLWGDPQAPAVAAVNDLSAELLASLAADGQVTVVLRPATFLDGILANDASTRAVGALGCAVDQGLGWEYWNALLSSQPANEGDGWTDEDLTAIGAGIGAEEGALSSCIASRTYIGWAEAAGDSFSSAGIAGVPYATLDGTEIPVEQLSNPQVLSSLLAARS